ncbi:TetR/AcrR family transcriptional regulator [Gordonia iterans]
MTIRLSRAQQRERTQSELRRIARAEFLRQGYAATRLDTVAELAGYSKGAVYSNFADKRALCQAVLTDIRREKFAEIAAITSSSDDVDQIADKLGDWIRATVGDAEWTALELEFSALARTDPTVHALTADARRDFSAAIAALLTDVLGDPAELAPGLPGVGDLADLLLSTGIGLGISRAFDPDVSLEPGIAGLKALFGLLAALR